MVLGDDVENFLFILIYLVIGLVLRRVPKFSAETPVILNNLVLYVALPALIIEKLPQLHFSWALLIPALTPWLLLGIVVLLILGLRRLLQWDRATTAAMLIVLPLGNTSFLGFPMIQALFGEAWMPYAMIYDQFGSFVALATYSSILAAYYGENQPQVTWRSMVLRIATFPPFLALFVGLLLQHWVYPPIFANLLHSLSATLVPLIMIAVGYQLQFAWHGERVSPLVTGLSIKLIVMPLLALMGCLMFGFSGKAVDVAVFEAATPPMISAGAIAMMAGLAPRLVAGLVGYGLLLSFLTLPLWHWLLSIYNV